MNKSSISGYVGYLLGLFILTISSFIFSQSTQSPLVELNTDLGKIIIELDIEKAPITVDNFLSNIKDFHYDGVIFHRVISGFMIQAGGFTFDLSPKNTSREPIANESKNGLSNKRGTISMARTNDPNSAKAQFFINHMNNERLDGIENSWGYAVFGKVKFGMNVVDKIASLPTHEVLYFKNIPKKPPMIISARILSEGSWRQKEEKTKNSIERPTPKTIN